ncbi:MAG: tRNA pseudouridine(55) synthase TruB [Haliangiales bacterium]
MSPRADDRDRRARAELALAAGGVLIVDKPAGPTSAQVVAKAKRALGARRVGHTGTLDPMATGVLPLCVGSATKIAGYLLADDKVYEGALMLGVETDTLDAAGAITAEDRAAAAAVDEAAVRACAARFVGPGEQVPPMYSALRQRGRRLHQLARAGQVVERAPRAITIYELTLTDLALPEVRFRVHCSKGTYVRSLAADIGAALGCGAHLTALRRVRSGPFALADAVALADLSPESAADALIPVERALPHLPSLTVAADRCRDVASGKKLTWHDLAAELPPATGGAVKLTSERGQLLALIAGPEANTSASERIQYLRVVPSDLTRRA